MTSVRHLKKFALKCFDYIGKICSNYSCDSGSFVKRGKVGIMGMSWRKFEQNEKRANEFFDKFNVIQRDNDI
jgi:hypothetical protein